MTDASSHSGAVQRIPTGKVGLQSGASETNAGSGLDSDQRGYSSVGEASQSAIQALREHTTELATLDPTSELYGAHLALALAKLASRIDMLAAAAGVSF